MCKEAKPTTLSSKKLWVLCFINIIAWLSYFHAANTVPPETAEVIFANYMTFLFFFNATYIGANVAQKWALK